MNSIERGVICGREYVLPYSTEMHLELLLCTTISCQKARANTYED